MKRTLSLALVLLMVSAGLYIVSCSKKQPTTYSQALAMSKKANQPVLLDFFTEW